MKVAVGKCWVDYNHCTSYGYTRVSGNGRSGMTAHKLAYEVLVGPIPESLELDHICRNRQCYNPAHLEPVTRQENIRRGPNFRNGKCWRCGTELNDLTAGRLVDPGCVAGFYYRCRRCHNERARKTRQRKKEVLSGFSPI